MPPPQNLAFTSILSGNEALIAHAQAGLPGLAADIQLGRFATWTAATTFARKLNEDLGVGRWESEHLITDALLSARKLIGECETLRRNAKKLRQSAQNIRIALALSELNLCLTLCQTACSVTAESAKKQALRLARNSLTAAVSTVASCGTPFVAASEIHAAAARLQALLNEYPVEK